MRQRRGRTRRRQLRSSRRARATHALVAAFQVLAIFMAVQLSGLGHIVQDLVQLAVAGAIHEDDCSSNDNDCPPGCPSCHCAPATATCIPPSVEVPVLTRLQDAEDIAAALHDNGDRPSPDLPDLYRPPRSQSRS